MFVLLLFALAGCWKKSGDAIVIAKDYLPAAPVSVSPNESPIESTAPSPSPAAEGEEVSDDANSPAGDPRATDHEQWIARVQMVRDLRVIDVRMEQAPWEKLKIGDRVHVKYREGKYTGTVWSSEID